MAIRKIIRQDGLLYYPTFVNKKERHELIDWLATIYPIWEWRYSKNNPPPPEDEQRRLLRPVYWLGNWQFACLDYYHPPQGIKNRCIRAEDFSPTLKAIIKRSETIVHQSFKKLDIPSKWHLNTCLVNFYGSSIDENEKKIDTARVGDHKDFEPGPVVSLSLGERAFFKFVQGNKNKINNVVYEQWLDDSSLLIFGGDRYKNKYFHRVQRVENKIKKPFNLNLENFETRRINFTFRYVPNEHIIPYSELPNEAKEDVIKYMEELASHSQFFRKALIK